MFEPSSLEQDTQGFTVLVYKIFVRSRPFSLLLTRPSVTFEVSTTPVAKLTRDSISWAKGLLIKPKEKH